MGGERESERGREGERAWVENGAISPLPGCVLQMTLKSSCSQAAPLLLASLSPFLSGSLALSVATANSVCRCSVPAVCSSAGGRRAGGKARLFPSSPLALSGIGLLLGRQTCPGVAAPPLAALFPPSTPLLPHLSLGTCRPALVCLEQFNQTGTV